MPMVPFVRRFQELGVRETRSIRVTGRADLPDDEYGFLELYCDEAGCDCRRVMIDVLREGSGKKIWATINYGWESREFYRLWDDDPADMKGPFLDILNTQSEYSPVLLEMFKMLLQSPDYVQRLKRHYRMFKDAVDLEHGPGGQDHSQIANRRRRVRDPRRRGKHRR